MLELAGLTIYRFDDVPWTHRVRFGGMKSRAKVYFVDEARGIRMTLVDFPVGSTEPRHVHPGTHATTVVNGRAIVDGVTLGPLDVILGPGGEPHGPLHYPDGCQLLSAFQGSNEHTEAESLSPEKHYRLVQHEAIPWAAEGSHGRQSKTLIDRGAGPLLVRAVRQPPGGVVERHLHDSMQAALVVEGSAEIAGQRFGTWDLLYQHPGIEHGPIRFPEGATLLAFTMRTPQEMPS